MAENRAAADVIAERERQISHEGWSPEHDDEHQTGDLGKAAAIYILYGNDPTYGPDEERVPAKWPWDEGWWKPGTDRRRQLVKAGALILAEIERLDRLAERERQP